MRTRTLAEARAAIARGDVAENSAVRRRMTGRHLSRSNPQFLELRTPWSQPPFMTRMKCARQPHKTHCPASLLASEAINNTAIRQKASQLNAAPGGVPTVVKGWRCPEIERMTGSMARLSRIKGVNPGYL